MCGKVEGEVISRKIVYGAPFPVRDDEWHKKQAKKILDALGERETEVSAMPQSVGDPMTYYFQGFEIRPDMVAAIRRYIDDREAPGDFLTAIICNDLKEAVGRADDEKLLNLPAFVGYFYNEAPSLCWGSREKMVAWLCYRDEVETNQ